MKGFQEKLAAGGFVDTILDAGRRVSAGGRLARMRRSNPDAMKPGGIFGGLKYMKGRYDAMAASPGHKVRKAIGATALGVGGVAAGLNHLSNLPEPGRVDAPPPAPYQGGMQ